MKTPFDRLWIPGLCLIVLGTVPQRLAAREGVRTERIDYKGWSGAYRLSNGTVELVFVPQIGRIMRYGYAGEQNFLWEHPALLGKTVPPEAELKEWINYGGDKLWPAPQDRWGWPPDPYLDRGAHQVETLRGGRLRVTGPASPRSGIRYRREITLRPRGTEVLLKNTMQNTGERPVEWSVWEVAQVDSPDEASLPLYRRGRYPEGFSIFQTSPPAPETVQVKGETVRLRRHPARGGKIGSDSPRGWTAARKGDLRMTLSTAFRPGKVYPEEGRYLHLWSNPDPLPYMELEVLSPLRKLAPGESDTLTTRWRLERSAPVEAREGRVEEPD